MEEALEKYTPILDDTMADIKTQKLELAGQRDALEQAGETVDQIQQDLTQHIRSVCWAGMGEGRGGRGQGGAGGRAGGHLSLSLAVTATKI